MWLFVLDNEIIVLSDENFITRKLYCNRQIFIYNLDSNEWKKFTVPKHQISPDFCAQPCVMSVGNNTIYMHGGYKGLYLRPSMLYKL